MRFAEKVSVQLRAFEDQGREVVEGEWTREEDGLRDVQYMCDGKILRIVFEHGTVDYPMSRVFRVMIAVRDDGSVVRTPPQAFKPGPWPPKTPEEAA